MVPSSSKSPISTSKGEWFLDFHIGPAWTQSANLSIFVDLGNLDFDTAVSIGGRFGQWFKSYPFFGLTIDVSHFRPDIDRQNVVFDLSSIGGGVVTLPLDPIDISVTEIAFDAMLRYPLLVTKEFPNGQVQPYFSIGPSIFVTKADPTGSTGFSSDTDTSMGVKIGTGVAWQFHRRVALFGEYRFTHFSPQFKTSSSQLNISGLKVETDVNTHRLLFGASYRFQP